MSTGGPRRSFVGREQELSEIDRAFGEGARLVTVTGSAGTGKTRLAERFVERSRASSAHEGSWFCALSQVRGAAELCALVSGQLGLPAGGRDVEQSAEAIGRALAGRGRGLLVLDNLEHLLEPAASLLALWQDEAPEIEFLVTSQERLRLDDERCIAPGPLPVPPAVVRGLEQIQKFDAVRLFLDRARAASRSFEVDEASAPLVAAIVRSLDGIPLAIELAAARAGMLGLRELYDLLERRFEVLVAERGSPVHRHATLRGAIDWSWGLTSPAAQAALASASIFRGGFSLAAFEHVVADEARGSQQALDLLQALYDKSFLRALTPSGARGERRYFLYESIRAYAHERLEASGGLARAELRHAEWFLALGERAAASLEGAGGAEMRRSLELERENLLAVHERGIQRGDRDGIEYAIRAVLPLEVAFAMQGPFERYVALLDQALASSHAVALSPALIARAQLSRGRMHVLQGRFAEALHDFGRARELAELAGDRRALAQAWVKAGQAAAMEGQPEAEELFARGRELVAELGDPGLERQFSVDLSLVRSGQGRIQEALALSERALELARELGNRREEAVAMGNTGARLSELGHSDAARDHYTQAIAILTEIGDRRAAAVFEAHLANMDQERGDLASAKARLERALAVQREVGDWAWEGLIQGYFGHIALLEDKARQAASAYREAGAILPGSYRRWAGQFLASQAVAEALIDDATAAAEHLAQARTTLEAVGSPMDRVAWELFEAVVDLIDARREGRNETVERRAAMLARRLRVRADESPVPDEVRFALCILEREIERGAPPARSGPRQIGLVAARDGSWFELGVGDRVDLQRRAPLRSLFAELVSAHQQRPGEGLSLDRLFDVAWPGARIRQESRAARVYVAINTLRKLGLASVLLRHDDGYLLDPRLDVELSAE